MKKRNYIPINIYTFEKESDFGDFQYDLNGNLISVYSSASEAAFKNNFSQGNISSCCRGERKTHKGYKWSYQPL